MFKSNKGEKDMTKLSAAALFVALALVGAPRSQAQTKLDFTMASSQCFGGVWPINCGVTVSDGSQVMWPEQVFGLKLVGMDIKSFCLGIFGCPNVDSLVFEGSLTQFHFPASISISFHQTNAALGPDGVYDDSYSGHITFNMSYNCHSSGGGRGSHNVVCTAQVIGIDDASITWVD
jgi:hypothetical protein